MLNFVNGVAISLAIGVAASLWQAKPGQRLKDSLNVTFAVLAISMACGLAALLGVEVTGISTPR